MLSRLGARKSPGAAAPPAKTFRPALEGLEDRLALAAPGTLGLPLAVTGIVPGAAGAPLQAIVTFAGQVSTIVPLDLTTTQVAGQECPVLNLHLGEIHLNLLGLHVDTSEICLDVTAVDHQGLLGGLLCDLTGGLDLGGILNQIGGQLNTLLGDLDQLLDGVLGGAMNVTSVFGQPVGGGATTLQDEAFCDILNLSLGPVDLQVPLLGVNVSLDNCADGPVTVDVTADPNGGLLGGLLCGLADGIDLGGLNTKGLNRLINRVDRLIDRLTDLTDRLGQVGQLTDRLEKVIDRLEKLVDRADDLHDLDKLIGRLDKTLDQLDKVLDRLI